MRLRDPIVEDFLQVIDSKYRLIHVISQRSRQLQEGCEPLIEGYCYKANTLALHELLQGKLEWELLPPEVVDEEHLAEEAPRTAPVSIARPGATFFGSPSSRADDEDDEFEEEELEEELELDKTVLPEEVELEEEEEEEEEEADDEPDDFDDPLHDDLEDLDAAGLDDSGDDKDDNLEE